MARHIEPVSANGPPALLAMARALIGEYAAMPHIAARWATPSADIAALPAPYVLPSGILLVVHEEGEALGCGALIAFAPGIGEIKRVYVRPQARGRGVGEAVTRALLDYAVQLGFGRVRLDTAPELLAAQALYQRLGFVAIPHYRDGLLPDTLCFEWALGGARAPDVEGNAPAARDDQRADAVQNVVPSVRLADHDPTWADAFEAEAAQLRDALGPSVVALHHIGSTAVPGLVAKPIIDMLAVVTSLAVLDQRGARLEALGYEAFGEFGVAGRRYFRKNASDGTRTHHLHAFTVGSDEIRRHVDFRDYLRAHPAEASAYGTLKRALARTAIDSGAYTEAKTDFILARSRPRHA